MGLVTGLIVMGILGVVLTIVFALVKYESFNGETRALKHFVPWTIIATLVVMAGMIVFNMFMVIPAGSVGVQDLFGKVTEETLKPGFGTKNPFAKVVFYDIRVQEYTMSIASAEGQRQGDDSIDVQSKDQLKMKVDVTVVWRIDPEKASLIYRSVSPDMKYISENLVRPVIRTGLRDAGRLFTSSELVTEKRDEFAAQAKQYIATGASTTSKKENGQGGIAQWYLFVDSIQVRNVAYPAEVEKAIESKKVEEQNAQKKDYEIQKDKKEAERKKIEAEGNRQKKIIEAKAESESVLIVAEGQAKANRLLSQSLTSLIIQNRSVEAFEKAAENKNMIIISRDGSMPILNIGGAVAK